MGFYSDSVVPRLVTCACGTKPILKQREKIVPKAAGRVLEIGMGAGHNLPYYRPEQIQGYCGHRSLLDQLETRPAAGG